MLEADAAQLMLGVTGTLYVGGIDLAEIVGREFDVDRADVLFEATQGSRPEWRDAPWLLRQQPCEGDLAGVAP